MAKANEENIWRQRLKKSVEASSQRQPRVTALAGKKINAVGRRRSWYQLAKAAKRRRNGGVKARSGEETPSWRIIEAEKKAKENENKAYKMKAAGMATVTARRHQPAGDGENQRSE
jgi:hypothetical protein